MMNLNSNDTNDQLLYDVLLKDLINTSYDTWKAKTIFSPELLLNYKSNKFSPDMNQKYDDQLCRYSNDFLIEETMVTEQHNDKIVDASRITLGSTQNCIVCSAPVPGPERDFRRFYDMLYSNKIEVILMLTPYIEGDYIKADRYIPPAGESRFGARWARYGDFWIKAITIPQKFMYIDVTQIVIRKANFRYASHCVGDNIDNYILDNEPNDDILDSDQIIHHIHFTEWTDFAAPDMQKFDNFMKIYEIYRPINSDNVVVHCSGGVGRTGVFCAIEAIKNEIRTKINTGESITEITINLVRTVQSLRECRNEMVQSDSQLGFIFDAIVAFVVTNNYC